MNTIARLVLLFAVIFTTACTPTAPVDADAAAEVGLQVIRNNPTTDPSWVPFSNNFGHAPNLDWKPALNPKLPPRRAGLAGSSISAAHRSSIVPTESCA